MASLRPSHQQLGLWEVPAALAQSRRVHGGHACPDVGFDRAVRRCCIPGAGLPPPKRQGRDAPQAASGPFSRKLCARKHQRSAVSPGQHEPVSQRPHTGMCYTCNPSFAPFLADLIQWVLRSCCRACWQAPRSLHCCARLDDLTRLSVAGA